MSDDEKAQRLERLRAGYRKWHRAKYGDPEPREVPEGELTPEEWRRITEVLSLPETEPSATPTQGRQRKPPA
jgi:hypothetical protein